jgi:hypothetical protein
VHISLGWRADRLSATYRFAGKNKPNLTLCHTPSRESFRASLLGQSTTGTVDVAEDHVRLEVKLPWLLSLLARWRMVSLKA